MHEAAYGNQEKTMQDLNQVYGFDLNSRTHKNNLTPLHLASIENKIGAVSKLIELGADVNNHFIAKKTDPVT